jgi:hypothetical protein
MEAGVKKETGMERGIAARRAALTATSFQQPATSNQQPATSQLSVGISWYGGFDCCPLSAVRWPLAAVRYPLNASILRRLGLAAAGPSRAVPSCD